MTDAEAHATVDSLAFTRTFLPKARARKLGLLTRTAKCPVGPRIEGYKRLAAQDSGAGK